MIYEGEELAGSRPTKTCQAAPMLGKGKSQGSIHPSHDLNLKSAGPAKVIDIMKWNSVGTLTADRIRLHS